MDKTNNKWSEFVVTLALMIDIDNIILDRIAFGRMKELEEIYSDQVYNRNMRFLSWLSD
jgi:hypothetical protein